MFRSTIHFLCTDTASSDCDRPVLLHKSMICVAAAIQLSNVGCNGPRTIEIFKYPPFYHPSIQRIAVIPFANRTVDGGVAERFSNRLEAMLIRNGTYEVYTRDEEKLRHIFEECDAAKAGIISGDNARCVGRLINVQGFLGGVYNRVGANTQREIRTRKQAIWGLDHKGRPTITGWRDVRYEWSKHTAVVDVHVAFTDAVTGRQWAAFSRPVSLYSAGSPPRYGPGQVLQVTENTALAGILDTIAVTKKLVRLRGKPLRLANDFYDQKWTFTNRFSPSKGRLIAVDTLPTEAARNGFNITIVPRKGREVLAEQEFQWPEDVSQKGYDFSIDPIVEQGGFGHFTAKLYSGPKPIVSVDFTITPDRTRYNRKLWIAE